MMRYVTLQGIGLVTASDTVEYDREDTAMLSVPLDQADLAALNKLQPAPAGASGGGGSCSECCHPACRTCQAALTAAGCAPFTGAPCVACAWCVNRGDPWTY